MKFERFDPARPVPRSRLRARYALKSSIYAALTRSDTVSALRPLSLRDRKDFSLSDRYRRPARSLALCLGLMGCIGQSQAQFGATGTSELPLLFVFGPWIALLVVLPGAWWLRPAWRPRLGKAMRRAAAAYLLIELVPLPVFLLVATIFDIDKMSGLMLWALALLGVIFSGLVLLVFVSAALALDWAFSCWRKARS